MMLAVVPTHEDTRPPIIEIHCDYQVKVDCKTWKCMSEEEYQSYYPAQAQRDKEAFEEVFLWVCIGLSIFLILIVVVVLFI